MTKRQALLWLDSSMLLSFAVLMSWRLSGVAAHEWIGFTLIALILAHLVVHWSWVESSVGRVLKIGRKARFVPLLLNTALFVFMGTAIISGIVISKVVIPNTLGPVEYLQWHGVHDTAAKFTLLIVGLHIALNWDRIRFALRNVRGGAVRSAVALSPGSRLSGGLVFRRLAWIAAASGVLVSGVWAMTRIVPSHVEVVRIYPDGHQERIAPPPELA